MSIAPTAREAARRQHDKAMRITRYAELDGLGAEGQQTAAALHQLPEEKWIVFHDLRLGRAVLDHVVVGPPGVFVVDRRSWTGTITVKGDVLRRNGIWHNLALRRSTRYAEALLALVPTMRRELVWPVLSVATEEQVLGCAKEVLIASTPTLAWTMKGCPQVLSVTEIDRLAWEMEASLDGHVIVPPAGWGRESTPVQVPVAPRHRAAG
ncbi:NERD domain-containing protein [Nocardioides coralli]|uniref:NERD domain-containing protein n=1 Tax=Nocardioides coralli TaxID=2872154 RepID=UPI001CA3F22B|nr:NERD domain-containing protein [Nocardioides coralli]QZY29714.1 NERD domain-containing protein [Nocardioides coralli]